MSSSIAHLRASIFDSSYPHSPRRAPFISIFIFIFSAFCAIIAITIARTACHEKKYQITNDERSVDEKKKTNVYHLPLNKFTLESRWWMQANKEERTDMRRIALLHLIRETTFSLDGRHDSQSDAFAISFASASFSRSHLLSSSSPSSFF